MSKREKNIPPQAIPKEKLCMHSRIISKHGVKDCNIPIKFCFGQWIKQILHCISGILLKFKSSISRFQMVTWTGISISVSIALLTGYFFK